MTCRTETHGFDCDTEFVSGITMTAEQIVDRCSALAPKCRWIIVTGGEPLLQLDEPLVDRLKGAGYMLAIETNGSIQPTPRVMECLDWIACSPKVAEHAVRLERCDELKYVRAYGQGIPKPSLQQTTHRLLSPAASSAGIDRETLAWCTQLVQEHPDWRLSVQQHKIWNIR